ncbi:hypothetical protein UFOVP348_2 [uncultured Caudovirales phage]|uniref:Uncharacterized protein n=1 Tax=uncultured Caudovirales phage TaxID=2100421 RepID=A0A6J5M1E0_9CAUD|nr:hypothetical protein UFOVP348_2 [uncultured Caudovirales phage]
MSTLDTTATLTALHRTNAIARMRKLALHEIVFEAREASSLEALRMHLERIVGDLEALELEVVSKA